ncbi:MAG: TerC family protein [Gammaproteobacteria bacterium]|nr:TerC family protein [Gammaproteobacteria bacterium]
MLEILSNPEVWAALLTLIALEIILGIDNIVFISILVGNLPPAQRDKARQLGLGLALVMRLLLLFSLAWLIGLTSPWITLFGEEFSGRDLILIAGGLFLLAKSTHEIDNSLEVDDEEGNPSKLYAGFTAVILQIGVIDMVFSLDSVITAVGLVEELSIMVTAIVISMLVMLVLARPLGEFVDANPTFKMLALSFLILIGSTLIAEGFDFHIPRGYIYFAMTFSMGVEFLNMLARKRRRKKAVHLHKKIRPQADIAGD